MRILAVIAFILMLNGCANTSEVFRTSENTFQVTARATWELGGLAASRSMALKAGSTKCESIGKILNVIRTEENYEHFSGGTTVLTFSCK